MLSLVANHFWRSPLSLGFSKYLVDEMLLRMIFSMIWVNWWPDLKRLLCFLHSAPSICGIHLPRKPSVVRYLSACHASAEQGVLLNQDQAGHPLGSPRLQSKVYRCMDRRRSDLLFHLALHRRYKKIMSLTPSLHTMTCS